MRYRQAYESIAINQAIKILHRQEYQAVRSRPSMQYDLIAWRGDDKPLFIRIKRSRRSGVTQFRDEIAVLADIVRRHLVPGQVEIWVYSRGAWSRYRVLAGGTVFEEYGI